MEDKDLKSASGTSSSFWCDACLQYTNRDVQSQLLGADDVQQWVENYDGNDKEREL